MIGLLAVVLLGVAEAKPSAPVCGRPNTQADRFFAVQRTDADPDRAVQLARTAAHEAAVAGLCGTGVPALECEARLQLLRPVGDVAPTKAPKRQWSACALLVAPQSLPGLLGQKLVNVRDEVSRTAAALPDGALFLEAPVWSTGADAGAAGHGLRAELAEAAKVAGRTIVATAAPDATTVRLRLSLVGADEAFLVPEVVTPKGVEEGRGFRFPTAFFQLDLAAAKAGRGYEAFGLSGGNRVGADGLAALVELTVDGTTSVDRDFCEHDVVRPSARVAGGRSADLMLFAVDADGNGFLLDRAAGSLASFPLGVELVDTSGGRQEAFAAVAVPPGRTGAWSSWRVPEGYAACRLPAPLHAGLFPADAAFTLAHYTIHREGTGRCTPVAGVDRTPPDPSAFPVCGAGR